MTKSPKTPNTVKEPAQVYLAADDSELLARLSTDTGLSKAEVLRRGIRSFAREQAGASSPMMEFLKECLAAQWPDLPAKHHDDVILETLRAEMDGRH